MTPPRSVPREFYEEMKARALAAEAENAQYRAMYGKLVDQVVDIKRAELSLMPRNFDPEALDPMKKLGSKTQAAIEEESGGDPGLRTYLRNFALNEYLTREGSDTPADEIDTAVAKRIREGDTG
jgi:hypothetical protein